MVERVFIFLGLFAVVSFFEAIGGSYIIAALQNIEKQFQIPSKFSGFIISASDIGYIPTVLFVSYLGSKGNRAKWIGAGSILMALTYLAIASPNFLFPVVAPRANLTLVSEELVPQASQLDPNASLATLFEYPLIRDRIPHSLRESLLEMKTFNMSEPSLEVEWPTHKANVSFYSIDGWLLDQILTEATKVKEGQSANQLMTSLKAFIAHRPQPNDIPQIRQSATAPFSYCGKLVNNIRRITQQVRCEEQGSNLGAFTILFTALFLLGIGRTMPWSLGVPLLDDNIKKRSLPLYFGGISAIRILGPICGHLIGSMTNKIYYTLQPPSGLTASDPTWIGAWWIGFLFVGTATLIPSVVLYFFPSGKGNKIGEEKKPIEFYDRHHEKAKEGTLLERAVQFSKSYKEVLQTKIYRGSVFGRILDIMAFKGYIVFLPKYLENHFGIPLFRVHQFMAAFGVFGFGLGTAVGGVITRKFKFTGRQAALFVLLISILNLSFYFSKAFISCQSVVNAVGESSKANNYNFTQSCNADCGCGNAKLYPVCSADGTAYYSPCHAGCREVKISKDHASNPEFLSCDCVPDGGIVRKDYCQDDCKWPKALFFATVICGSFSAGMGLVPGMLILLRSVPPKSRSISLGLQGLLVSLFGTLPSPVVWGAIIDSACLIWEKSCDGSSGHCSIYDPHSLRTRMHFTYVAIRVVSLTMDIYVYYHAKNLSILDEDDEKQKIDEENGATIGMQPIVGGTE